MSWSPLDLTATGGGYYRVWVDGVVVSQHVAEREAVEQAAAEKRAAPALEVRYDHAYQVRVDLPTERRSGRERRERDVIGTFGRRLGQRRGAVRQYPVDPQDAPVSYLTVTSPTPPSLGPSDTFQLTSDAESAPQPAPGGGFARVILTGRPRTYLSLDTDVVTVDGDGLVSYAGAGTTDVEIECEGVRVSQAFTCVSPQAAVASVDTNPTSFVLAVGATMLLSATPRDSGGNALVGRVVTWASDDTDVATVGADSGDDNHYVTVTGVGEGPVTITPTCETVAGTGSAGTVNDVDFDGYAELPREYVDVAYALPSGDVYTVKNSGGDYTPAQLPTALNDAAANGIKVIVVDDDVVLDRTAPMDPPAKAWDDWTYVVTASVHDESFPRTDEERVQAADTGQMATLRVTANNQPVLRFQSGVNHARKYRFVGFQITTTATTNTGALVSIEGGSNPDYQPEDIIIDRCIISATPGTNWGRRGVRLDGKRCAVVNSRVVDFIDQNGSDSQAVWMLQGVGPCRISNNYLTAASENLFWGGGGTAICPADIHVHHNHVVKPLAWLGVYGSVKNLLEVKNARRLLVEYNVFENCWTAAQTGGAWTIMTSSQGNGDAPQYQTTDITLRWNTVRNCEQWFTLIAAAGDTNPATAPSSRITIRQNLFYDPRNANLKGRSSITKSTGTTPVAGLTIENNTGIYTASYQGILLENRAGSYYTGTKADNVDFNYNIFCSGSGGGNYGFFGCSGVVPGYRLLTDGWTNVTCEDNGLIGPSMSGGGFPASNVATGSATLASAQFVDLGNHDYTLAGGSPFKGIAPGGADPGVDFAALQTAIAGVA